MAEKVNTKKTDKCTLKDPSPAKDDVRAKFEIEHFKTDDKLSPIIVMCGFIVLILFILKMTRCRDRSGKKVTKKESMDIKVKDRS